MVEGASVRHVLRGARAVVSIPAAVLICAQVGFAALARELGFGLLETMAIAIGIWALPAQVVFVGLAASGVSLAALAVAVGLTSVRFLPMVMAWTPVVSGPDTARPKILAASWLVAVTSWVFAMARLPELPREVRLSYFAGFAVALALATVGAVGLAHALLGALPAIVAGALVFLTPIYFVLALWGAARLDADRLALGYGLVAGPVAAALVPELDLLVAGLVGGTLAYLTARLARHRRMS